MSIFNNQEWQKIQTILKKNVGERLYSAWLEPTCVDSVEDSPDGRILKLKVPGPMYREQIASNFLPDIAAALASESHGPFKIELVVTVKNPSEESPTSEIESALNAATYVSTSSSDSEQGRNKRDFLNPSYTFSTFVVGQSSQVAHAACHSVSENPGKSMNPLYVCGPSGLGKTHLLNAIGNEIRVTKPHYRICYLSGEKFLNDYVSSIRHGQMEKFRKKFREQCDLLIIDDIHILAHKEGVQEEFFHTFNALHDLGKQVVFSSDKFPREIEGLEERVRTRLEWGLTVDIQPPDIETRMAILRYKAESTGLVVPDNVNELLAQISKKSVRELEGHLATLRMYSELKGVPVTYDFAYSIFSKYLNVERKVLSVDEIQKFIADKYSVSVKDLKSRSRVKTVVHPRQIAMYLCKKVLDLSVVEIGRSFGGRDHTTVLHSINKIKDSLKNEAFSNEINKLEKTINNSEWIT